VPLSARRAQSVTQWAPKTIGCIHEPRLIPQLRLPARIAILDSRRTGSLHELSPLLLDELLNPPP